MKPALEAELAGLLVDVGRRLVRIGELVYADESTDGSAPQESSRTDFNPCDAAMAKRELRSLGDPTPEEIEILNRLRPRKPRRGDDR